MSHNLTTKEKILAVVLLAGIASVIMTVCVLLPAKFERDAYERVTGKSVSTWDAIWLDLRVQESTGD